MVPSAFVLLDELPVTPSGKLDRRSLPAPDLGAYVSREYEAPRGEVEEILAGIWQEILHVERVGRNDNFFELGGHSLMGIKLLGEIRVKLGPSVPVSAVFRFPSISQMSAVVESLRHVEVESTGTGENGFEEGEIPLCEGPPRPTPATLPSL